MNDERNREAKIRRAARRQGFELQKGRGSFFRDYPEQAWLLSRDGRGELWGPNFGVSLDEVERYLAQKDPA